MVVRTQDIGRRCDVGDAPHSLEAGRQLVEVARTVDPAYLAQRPSSRELVLHQATLSAATE